MTSSRRSIACALLFVPLSSCGCGDDPTCRAVLDGPAGATAVRANVLTTGLTVPWSLAFLPDGQGTLVTERGGALRLIVDDVLRDAPLAEVPVQASGEGGLLGVAVDPDFNVSRSIYLYGTFAGENRIDRYLVDEDLGAAVFDATLLGGIPAGTRHDGGRLRFGPDGALYASTGEAGEPELSRDDTSLGGKILRINPDGSIPADNPDPTSPIYASGLRNPQGFDFLDSFADDGALVVVDHGPSGEQARLGHDELNIVVPGSDHGWPDRYACEASDEGLVAPRLTWVAALPPGGVHRVRGDAIPDWRGHYVVTALGAKQLQLVRSDTFDNEVHLSGDVGSDEGLGRLREVIEDPQGRLLVTTSNCDGRGTCEGGGNEDVIFEVVPADG